MKYLLSTGETTSRIEYYILDLFRLNLQIWPGDIPGAPGIGFDFIFNDVKKDEVVGEVESRISSLASSIKQKIGSDRCEVVVDKIEIIDESRVRITIIVNETASDTITLDIYDSKS